MHYRYHSAIPERMVVLALLPPPNSYEPRAPFGYGVLIVTRRWRGEAEFSSHAHGYGAGYNPQGMRDDIRKLFTPETNALIHAPAPPHAPKHATRQVFWMFASCSPRMRRELLASYAAWRAVERARNGPVVV